MSTRPAMAGTSRLFALALCLPALASAAPAPRGEVVLATCSAPKGRIHVTSPRDGWNFERAPDLSLSFVRDRAGRPDVEFASRAGSWRLRNERAQLAITHKARDYSYFIVTAVHQQARVDTFQVVFLPNGTGRLTWTSVRAHIPPRDETSASLLVATCTQSPVRR